MTTEEILSLTAGPLLDRAVHESLLKGQGKLEKFSTSDTASVRLLERVPMYVSRVPGDSPNFKAEKPWMAGLLKFNAASNSYQTTLSVTAATRAIAICKAALLITLHPGLTQPKVAGVAIRGAQRAQPGPTRSWSDPKPKMPPRPVAPKVPRGGAAR